MYSYIPKEEPDLPFFWLLATLSIHASFKSAILRTGCSIIKFVVSYVLNKNEKTDMFILIFFSPFHENVDIDMSD